MTTQLSILFFHFLSILIMGIFLDVAEEVTVLGEDQTAFLNLTFLRLHSRRWEGTEIKLLPSSL